MFLIRLFTSTIFMGFPGGSGLKYLPAMQETCVRSLGQEDPLEKEMATHSSILAWRIPCTEKPGGLQSTGSQESNTTERLHFHFLCFFYLQRKFSFTGEETIQISSHSVDNSAYKEY